MGSPQASSAAFDPHVERERRWQSHVRAIGAGDALALSALYDDTVSHLYGLAMRLLADPADAEEVTLEVFEQVWRSAGTFDSSRGTVWRWLSMLTRSRAIDRLRSRNAQRRHVAADEHCMDEVTSGDVLPDEANIFRQQQVLIRAALASLPVDQRRAVEMAYFSELTHTEISSALGVPLGTIKARIRKGVERLRLALGSERPSLARTMQ